MRKANSTVDPGSRATKRDKPQHKPASTLESRSLHSQDVDFPSDWFMVDTARYYSATIADSEREKIWRATWQAACRVSDVPVPGSWFEYVVGNQSYLVTRDDEERIHAFVNSCRHRGNRLCAGAGRSGVLTCGFHLWQYNLDGTLRAVPDRETFPHFDTSDLGLKRVSCALSAGFVFINADPEAASLEEYLGDISPLLEAYRVAEMVPVGLNVTMRIGCNWKVGIDAFSESYHVAAIHPQNLPMVDDYNQRYSFLDPHVVMMVPFVSPSPHLGDITVEEEIEGFAVLERVFRGRQAENPIEALVAPYRDGAGKLCLPDGVALRDVVRESVRVFGRDNGDRYAQLTENQLTDNYNFLLFPNLSLNLRPGQMTLFRFRPDPDGDPERCVWDAATYEYIEDPAERALRTAPVREINAGDDIGLVLEQDRVQLPRQQQGLRNRDLTRLQLSRQEAVLAYFHHHLDVLLNKSEAAPIISD